jgi:glycosyltransferase involved in cell wall biosynthesis
MNVAYLGPLRDYSGYGEANRHFVGALDAAGVHVVPQLVAYTAERSEFGDLGKRIDELIEARAQDKYDIKILHTTPDEYKRLIEPGKYHIGHFFWETDRVPDDFAQAFELVDEIWTGSEANRHALISTGVNKPVHKFPQPIETARDWGGKYVIPGFPDDGYLFYSIFEWTDRKNPDALLEAYYREFEGREDVGLLIKTYFRNFTLSNKRMIRNRIAMVKAKLGLKKYPPVYLYLDLMDRRQVNRIHTTGDCYVSAHRGEGWGVPQVEAALAGKPIISTGYGGCHEFFEHGDNALILPYEMVPLKGMEHSQRWYSSDQKWAEVDSGALRGAMRYAYAERQSAALMGTRARERVEARFGFERVGNELKERLMEIQEGLDG